MDNTSISVILWILALVCLVLFLARRRKRRSAGR